MSQILGPTGLAALFVCMVAPLGALGCSDADPGRGAGAGTGGAFGGGGAPGSGAPGGGAGAAGAPGTGAQAAAGGGLGAGTGAQEASGSGAMAGTGGADPSDDAGDWVELIAGDWDLPSFSEDYYCVRETVAEDIFVRGFRAINPTGTHHTVLGTVGGGGLGGFGGTPDGVEQCASFQATGDMIFGSGAGTDAILFPAGLALKIPAGTQLLDHLHLFNTTPDTMQGRSGAEVLIADDYEMLADNLLVGPLSLNIPTGVEHDEHGGCTMSQAVQVFSVQPHMHQTGIHARVTAVDAQGQEIAVLHDGPYDFDRQIYYAVDPPVAIPQGGRVEITCTYFNDTGKTLRFGESTEDEMCLASVYRFPGTAAAETTCSR